MKPKKFDLKKLTREDLLKIVTLHSIFTWNENAQEKDAQKIIVFFDSSVGKGMYRSRPIFPKEHKEEVLKELIREKRIIIGIINTIELEDQNDNVIYTPFLESNCDLIMG